MRFTVFPAVDISEGRCVRLLQGRFGSETVYSDNPVEVALGFARAGAQWLHIVDLDGAKRGVPANRELVLEVVQKASCPVQAGGGLRSIDDVIDFLGAGATRVVLGTLALEDRGELKRICERFGERIAVSLDARGGMLAGRGWTVGTGMPLVEAVRILSETGVSTLIYTDVGRDGTMSGPDLNGIGELVRATDLPVIASGGIASLEELRHVATLHDEGVGGAVVGRALYENKFSVQDAITAANEVVAGKWSPPFRSPGVGEGE